MSRTQLLAVALALAVCGSLVPAVAIATPATTDAVGDWPSDRGDHGRTGVNAGTAPTGPNATIDHEYEAPNTTDADWGEPTAPAVVDGSVYVGYDDTSGSVSYVSEGHVVAYDADTSDVRWNRSQLPKVRQTPTVAGDRVYVSGRGPYDTGMGANESETRGGVFALNATTGEVAWVRNGTDFDRVTGHLVAGDRVYVRQTRSLYALNATTGATVWERSDVSADAMAWGNGTLVTVSAGSEGPTVTALNPATGDRRWARTTTTEDEYVDPAGLAVANDTVYVSDGENTVSALLVGDGTIDWTTEMTSVAADVPAQSMSAPAVADGLVYVSSRDDDAGTVHAIDAVTGATAWRFEQAEAELFAPSVANGTVYVGAKQATEWGHLRSDGVYALNATDGTERWSYARQEHIDRTIVATAPANGTVYVAVKEREVFFNSGALYGVESTDDAVEPRHRFDSDANVTYAPTVTVTTEPSNATDRDLSPGTTVTLTANASDPDGTVAAVEWDVDTTGEFDRSAESIAVTVEGCGFVPVTVRVTDDDGEVTTDTLVLSTD